MSKVIILEFPGTADQYFAVNKILGIDYTTGEGDWPKPLESHIAAFGNGKLVVVEVWESEEAQHEFMSRLGPALGQVGVAEPSRMEWLDHLGHHNS
jgi:hypothetical protein